MKVANRLVGFLWVALAIGAIGCGSVSTGKTDAGTHTDSAPNDQVTADGSHDSPSGVGGGTGAGGLSGAGGVTGTGGATGTDGGTGTGGATGTDGAAMDGAVPDGSDAGGSPSVELLEGTITTLGGGATATGLTLEDDGLEELGPNCSTDGTVCLLFGGLEP